MATPSRNLTKTTVLPHGAAIFMRRRLIETAGIALTLVGIATAMILVSYYPGDPSLNAATTDAARNWLGIPAAAATNVASTGASFSRPVTVWASSKSPVMPP